MPLGNRDLDALQQAALDLHKERDIEEFREAVAGIVMRAVPADFFVWMEFGFAQMDASMRNIVHWATPPRLTPRMLKRLVAFVDQHPFTIHGKKTGDWGPLRLSDFWSTKQLLASPIYRDVYSHNDVGRLLACGAFRGNRVGTLNLSRPLKDRDFSERDRLMLKLLMPHFVQALQAAERTTARRDGESRPLQSLGLTPREVEVGVWLARGRTNHDIAMILDMRPRTVEKHVERILIKLGVENRTSASRMLAGTSYFSESQAPSPAKASRGRAKTRAGTRASQRASER